MFAFHAAVKFLLEQTIKHYEPAVQAEARAHIAALEDELKFFIDLRRRPQVDPQVDPGPDVKPAEPDAPKDA